jgi:hypothetical protein
MTESLLPRLEGNGKSHWWLRAHLDYPHSGWCLIWPFSRSQAGYAKFGQAATAVHRLMCEYKNGLPPSPKYQASHSCGRGNQGCVNPNHLSWKTNAENQIERYKHSGYQPQRKLTPEQVGEIRSLKGLSPVLDIAERFGVTPLNIHRIHAGKLWRKTKCHVFTAEEILRIKSAPRANGMAKGLAEEFGTSLATIHRIRNGEAYRHITAADGASPHSNPEAK